MSRHRRLIFILFLLCVVLPYQAWAEERFPPPDFVESDYKMPSVDYVYSAQPRANHMEFVDSLVLIAALGIGVYLVFTKRSRKWIYTLMIFSLIYFGFIRMGCVCSIGAIQNVSLSLFDGGYALPLVAAVFFLAPLILTLFYGRVFCGAVCPLGAIQDFVLVRPLRVPLWLESTLRLGAYVYLALSIVFAVTGTAFLICRYDPFISFFRFSGLFNMIVLGICFLVIGAFVGRPYCRFLCPYGVILRQVSRLSSHRVSITPDKCITCRLCEDACPFNAIDKPTVRWPEEGYTFRRKLLVFSVVLLPLVTILSGYAFSRFSGVMVRSNYFVHLADQIEREEAGAALEPTDASRAFRESGQTKEQLFGQAEMIRGQFHTGMWIAGLFVGLVGGLKLIGHSIQKKRHEYTANPASCFACGRCYQSCPRQHARDREIDNNPDDKMSGRPNA